MAMRRPKKLSRQTQPKDSGNVARNGSGSNASIAANRLGPGMETLDLRLTLGEGGGGSQEREAAKPWIITWQVGLGASVDKGWILAKMVQRAAASSVVGTMKEHVITAPREGILTELLIPTGGEVGVPTPAAPLSTTQADPQSQGIEKPLQAAGEGSAQDPSVEDPSEASSKFSPEAPSKDQSPSLSSQLSEESTQAPSPDSNDSLSSSSPSLSEEPDAHEQSTAAAVEPPPVTNHNAESETPVDKVIKPVEAVKTAAATTVVVGRLSFCGHPELHGTLCTSCGRNVLPGEAEGSDEKSGERGNRASGGFSAGSRERNSEDGGAMSKVTMKGGGTLTLSSTAARRMAIDKAGRLLTSKRLALVLDLDNTLLHCSDHPDAGRFMVPGAVDGVHTLRLPNQPREYYIKLRPGLRMFLAQAATMFEMTIYTAGTAQYADAVARVLDPDRRLFQGRHFSTCYTPDLGRNTKSLERIFPCGLDMALIVDDRDDVWRGAQANNLLLVRPYKFFVGQRSVPDGPTHGGAPQAPIKLPLRELSRDRSQSQSDSGSSTAAAAAATSNQDGPRQRRSDNQSPKEVKQEGAHSGDVSKNTGAPTVQEEGSETDELLQRPAGMLKSSKANADPHAPVQGDGGTAMDTETSVSGVVSEKGDGSVLSPDVVGKLGEGLAALLAKQREQVQGKNDALAGTGMIRSASDAVAAGDTTTSKRTPPENKSGRDDGGGGKATSLVNTGDRRKELPAQEQVAGDAIKSIPKKSKRTDEPAQIAPLHSVCTPTTGETAETVEMSVETNSCDITAAAAVTAGEDRASSSSLPNLKAAADSRLASWRRKDSTGTKDGGVKGEATSVEGLSPMSPPRAAVPRSPKHATLTAPVENDPQLDCTLKTLEAVHGAFYSPEHCQHGQSRDVARFLAKVRSRVLRGVRMVFSGVIPVSGMHADPRTHKLWRMAEAHGATVDGAIDRYTTHVVAVRLGTAKTTKGLRMPGVCVVHLDWLMNSVWHCRRERETIFLLAGQICGGAPPPQPPVPTTPPRYTAAQGTETSTLTSTSTSTESSSPSCNPVTAAAAASSSSPLSKRNRAPNGLSPVIGDHGERREVRGGKEAVLAVSDREGQDDDGEAPHFKRKRESNHMPEGELLNSARGGAGAAAGGRRLGAGNNNNNSGESGCGSSSRSSRSSSVGSDGGDWLMGMADELDNSL